ncbi:MAG: serine protease [Verrucomicrobiota bacterium]|jgi:S1-C subfamily serine protease
MKLLAGLLCALFVLPALAADRITAVTLDGVSYAQIQDVHVAGGGRVAILYPSGGTTVSGDKLPKAFLDSWGITAAQLAESRAAAERQAEQALAQAISTGYFRQVEGVIYDLRKPQASWMKFFGARILQVVRDGALLELSPNQPNPAVVFLRNLPPGFSDHDTITVMARLSGTFSYIDRLNYERTLHAYDAGHVCQRNEIPPAMLKEGLAVFALPDAPKPPDHSIASLPNHDRLRGIGTGFFVTKDGYLLTNHHVVREAGRIEVKYRSQVFKAKVIEVDKENDLAALKVEGDNFQPLSISRAESADLGQEVFTIGFPNIEMQGVEPKYTDGKISSLAGMQDDPAEYQISVPVQPGNSGGPLCDVNGQVVGIVVARLNDFAVLQTSGVMPQNVNYAVKSRHALRLLQQIKGAEPNLPQAGKPENVVKTVAGAVAMVLIY